MEKLNLVFMGTPDFAVSALQNLIENHNVIAVYTKEPKPVGRKMILTKSPVHLLAEKNNIPVYTPKNFKSEETINELKELNPDMIIVAAYGIILPQSVLDIPTKGCINIHASLLPNLRGANPIQRAIINGDKVAGITIMKMDAGMDTGDMLLTESIDIDLNTTYGELEEKLSAIGAKLIIQYLDSYDFIQSKPQPSNFTIAPKLNKEEAKIDWTLPAIKIHNLVRGLSPYPYANCKHNENILKIIKSEVIYETTTAPAGTILNKNMDIACGNNTILRILEIQKVGGKPMKIKDFLNGYKLDTGDILQ